VTATRAAEILEKDGQTESAVNLFRDIGNWEELIRLIRKHAPSLISQGRNRMLEGWLKSLPGKSWRTIPGFSIGWGRRL